MARNQFASKFGTMAAIAGSAVGLGNIWKFPYVAGQNGGAAFLIIYIVISLLISVPVMLSEFVIGRRGQGNTYRSFINSSGKKGWGAVGAIEIFAGMVILAFYCVVAGWSLEYIIQSVVRRHDIRRHVSHVRLLCKQFAPGALDSYFPCHELHHSGFRCVERY